jgi:hypothetical protein
MARAGRPAKRKAGCLPYAHGCPVPEGLAGDFPVFRPKMQGLGNQRKFFDFDTGTRSAVALVPG